MLCTFCQSELEGDLESEGVCASCGATALRDLDTAEWTWYSGDYNKGWKEGYETGHRETEGVETEAIKERAIKELVHWLYRDMKFSQAAIGKAIGRSQASVSRILNGAREPGVFRKGHELAVD